MPIVASNERCCRPFQAVFDELSFPKQFPLVVNGRAVEPAYARLKVKLFGSCIFALAITVRLGLPPHQISDLYQLLHQKPHPSLKPR
jgi:hypothetical protein